MGNKKQKSGSSLLKGIEETKQRLEGMEQELEALREARYPVIGKFFYMAFYDCPDFDIFRMNDAKIRQFVRTLRFYYDYEREQEKLMAFSEPTGQILP